VNRKNNRRGNLHNFRVRPSEEFAPEVENTIFSQRALPAKPPHRLPYECALIVIAPINKPIVQHHKSLRYELRNKKKKSRDEQCCQLGGEKFTIPPTHCPNDSMARLCSFFFPSLLSLFLSRIDLTASVSSFLKAKNGDFCQGRRVHLLVFLDGGTTTMVRNECTCCPHQFRNHF
jgi:hypothetical protein